MAKEKTPQWIEIDLGELIKDVVESIIARTVESIERDYPNLKPVKIDCPLEDSFAYAHDDGIFDIVQTKIKLGRRLSSQDSEIH